MRPEILERPLMEFSAELFVEKTCETLRVEIERQGFRGVVLGVSGGIDSLVSAALCLRACRKPGNLRVVGLQMNDSRLRGESYNTEIYDDLGVDLVHQDITQEAIDQEIRHRMPPRWLTQGFMQIALRWIRTKTRRRLILAIKSERAPDWVLSHLHRLTLLHRVRITRLREYAHGHGLMTIICANRTERELGYFVQDGIDDSRMGDYAPISELYKGQVIGVAQFLRLPDKVIRQKPSPGFGGIFDEEILGPYELLDLVLIGMELGYPGDAISQAIRTYAGRRVRQKTRIWRSNLDSHYVTFVKKLVELNSRKRHLQETRANRLPLFLEMGS